jgi:hypothetical protein
MARRIDRKARKPARQGGPTEDFHRYRLGQAQRARTLGMLLLPFDDGLPDSLAPRAGRARACSRGLWPGWTGRFVASLRELQGVIGAHEWRKKGVPVSAAWRRESIRTMAVYSPVRGEYVDLVAKAPLPATADRAFDIGTGTGVLAAVAGAARRGARTGDRQ